MRVRQRKRKQDLLRVRLTAAEKRRFAETTDYLRTLMPEQCRQRLLGKPA